MKLFEGLPNEMKGPITEIYSNREAVVDGCKGVLDYHENLIKLRVDGGTVVFSGTDLVILELSDGAARLKGKIASVEFSLR